MGQGNSKKPVSPTLRRVKLRPHQAPQRQQRPPVVLRLLHPPLKTILARRQCYSAPLPCPWIQRQAGRQKRRELQGGGTEPCHDDGGGANCIRNAYVNGGRR